MHIDESSLKMSVRAYTTGSTGVVLYSQPMMMII